MQGPVGTGVLSPRPPPPDVADSLRRDAKLGREPRGRARRLGRPFIEDVDSLVRAQPDSPGHYLWTLWVCVDGDRRQLNDALGFLIRFLESMLCWADDRGIAD